MAEGEEEEVTETDGEGDGEDGAEKKGKFGIKMLVMLGLPVLLLLLGGGYFLMSYLSGSDEATEEAVEEVVAKPSFYYDMPEMVVNLSTKDKRAKFLKIKISLEASDGDAFEVLEPSMPRVMDMFQIYLRELRTSDLEGSAGIFHLKEELLKRINLTIHPNRIDRVLFKQIIIQ